MLFPPTLAHLYSSTDSELEENSYLLGHCSQKNKYVVKTINTKQYFLTLPPSASVPPTKYENSQEMLPLGSTSQSSWWPPAGAPLLLS